MEIQSTLTSRIAWRVGGTIIAVTFGGLSMIGYLTQGHDPVVLSGLLPAVPGLLMIFGLGRSAWIKAGESTIAYLPAIGRAKIFPRSDVKSIARVPSGRGFYRLEFRDQDKRRVVSCQEFFARSDVEKLSQFLGVQLIWDLLLFSRTAKPSWEEVKSQLDPEQVAEIEKHMKGPGAG